MTQININNKILQEIFIHATNDRSAAKILMDTLFVSSESAYRRLRGEVRFTLEEVAKLSSTFDFSVDELISKNSIEKSFVNLSLYESKLKIENLSDKFDRLIALFKKNKSDPNSEARYLLNTIPDNFYCSYDNLCRFIHFKWLHQFKQSTTDISFEKTVLSQAIIERKSSYISESRELNSSTIILDRNTFTGMKYDIEYFYDLQMLSSKDVKVLKEEMIAMLGEIEDIAKKGEFSTGKKVSMYISNIDIEVSNHHFEYKGGQYTNMCMYGTIGMESQIESVCRMHKMWIESYKKYSTVISVSGEIQRLQYFKKQRNVVNSIVNTDI